MGLRTDWGPKNRTLYLRAHLALKRARSPYKKNAAAASAHHSMGSYWVIPGPFGARRLPTAVFLGACSNTLQAYFHPIYPSCAHPHPCCMSTTPRSKQKAQILHSINEIISKHLASCIRPKPVYSYFKAKKMLWLPAILAYCARALGICVCSIPAALAAGAVSPPGGGRSILSAIEAAFASSSMVHLIGRSRVSIPFFFCMCRVYHARPNGRWYYFSLLLGGCSAAC